MAAAKKTERITIRLTDKEKECLIALAYKNDLNLTEYIRLLISHKSDGYPEVRKLMRELINEVNHIGNNINQIAKSSNAGIHHKDDLSRIMRYLEELQASADRVVVLLGNK